MYRKWPMPDTEVRKDVKFIFVLSLARSGSTVFAEMLNTLPSSVVLHEKGEGQWLIRGMCERGKWNKGKKMNYDSIKKVWSKRVSLIEKLSGNKVKFVIEKSPPNIMRVEEIRKNFENISFLSLNRNPIAYCSSSFKNNYGYEYENDRKKIFEEIAKGWIERSRVLKKWIEKYDVKHTSYERLCKYTSKCISKIHDKYFCDEKVHRGNINRKVSEQEIVNMNKKQISNLKEDDFVSIKSVLSSHLSLLSFFGYEDIINN